MRLINADKITITRQDYVGALTLKERLRRLLNSQPTVEAIPIVWLDMFMQRYKIQGDDEYKLLHFMVTEWKKWEKENEQV